MAPKHKGLMFPVGLPVFPICGAPQVKCTLGQPSETPTTCTPIEFKPHNPPISWKEAGAKYPMLPLPVSLKGGCGAGDMQFTERYLASLWVSCEHVLEFGIPMGPFSSKFWYPYGSKFLAWSAHPYLEQPPTPNTPTPTPQPGMVKTLEHICSTGSHINIETDFTSLGVSITKITVIFILLRRYLHIEMIPWCNRNSVLSNDILCIKLYGCL